MKLSTIVIAGASILAAQAQNVPTSVSILTPSQGKAVGVNGQGWMIDIVAQFGPAPVPGASSSASAATSAATGSTSGGGSTGSSGGGLYGYRKRADAAAAASNPDDGFFPLLNSPNLTTFAPGPDVAAPGLVCLVSTASDPTQNFAGVFQLNAITNSDASGDITEAYFSWFVGAPSFGSNVNSTVTVFFVNGTAPATYSSDPTTDSNVISNVATVDFFVFGDAASNDSADAVSTSSSTPVSIFLFTPKEGSIVGVDGAGWMIDMALATSDTSVNPFAPINGYSTLYHDNFTDSKFAPGVNPAIPGLVVLSNTSTLAGGASTNLANLFQINAVTGIDQATGIITEFWSTWLAGAAFAGVGVDSSLTIFLVNGTAPLSVNSTMPSNIISNVINVNFTTSGNTSTSASPSASSSATTGGSARVAIGLSAVTLALSAFLLF